MSAPSTAKRQRSTETEETIRLQRGDTITTQGEFQDDGITRAILVVDKSIPETRLRLWKALATTLNMETDDAAWVRIRLICLPKHLMGKVDVPYLKKHLASQIGPVSVTKSEDGHYYEVYLHRCAIRNETAAPPSRVYIGRIDCRKHPSQSFLRHF